MNLGAAVPVRVLETRDDGSGRVEIPVVTETPFIDFSQSEGGGPKNGAITRKMLAEMAANFGEVDRPVTVAADGLTSSGHQRDRGGPSGGFIDAVRFDGSTLWAEHDLGPLLFDAVVRQRAYRGYSIEARKDPQFPTGVVAGWVLRGGLFTNHPATDSHFQIAASAGSSADAIQIQLALGGGDDGGTMPDQDVAQLRAETKKKDDEITALKAKLAEAEKKAETGVADRQEMAATIKSLQDGQKSLLAKISEQAATSELAELKQLSEIAVKEKGIPGTVFDGMADDVEAWKAKSGLDLAALRALVKVSPDRAKEEPIKAAGGGNADGPEAFTKMDARIKAVAREQKIPYADAADLVRMDEPELFAAGMKAHQEEADKALGLSD